jgi:hypothetical protein
MPNGYSALAPVLAPDQRVFDLPALEGIVDPIPLAIGLF